ncbi:Hypothetical_protein [Hexamita inflata]|uniref:Hypothetical_protein n=1 Tax=Hexamita inflata TaxID=28002 RepID=A0ABP1HGT1_9EUKA
MDKFIQLKLQTLMKTIKSNILLYLFYNNILSFYVIFKCYLHLEPVLSQFKKSTKIDTRLLQNTPTTTLVKWQTILNRTTSCDPQQHRSCRSQCKRSSTPQFDEVQSNQCSKSMFQDMIRTLYDLGEDSTDKHQKRKEFA